MAKQKQILKPINRRKITVRLIGISPLIQHRFSEKAKAQMRDKHQGKKTKTREIRDPEAEGIEAGYYTPDGKPGVLAVAIKASVIEAAHRDLGIPRTLVCKSLFVLPMGRDVVLPLEMPDGKGKVEAVIEEDPVRIGPGSTDLRYRPYYYEWAVTTFWELDIDLLQTADFLLLLDRAGFGVGIHEWRAQKGGDFGRYQVDPNFKVIEEKI